MRSRQALFIDCGEGRLPEELLAAFSTVRDAGFRLCYLPGFFIKGGDRLERLVGIISSLGARLTIISGGLAHLFDFPLCLTALRREHAVLETLVFIERDL